MNLYAYDIVLLLYYFDIVSYDNVDLITVYVLTYKNSSYNIIINFISLVDNQLKYDIEL